MWAYYCYVSIDGGLYLGAVTADGVSVGCTAPSPKYWMRSVTEGEPTCLVGGLSEYLIWLRENDP